MPVENASDKWIAVFEGGASAPSIAIAQAAADAAEGFAIDASGSASTATIAAASATASADLIKRSMRFSLFPDRFFRLSGNNRAYTDLGCPLYVATQDNGSWDANIEHAYGKGAWKHTASVDLQGYAMDFSTGSCAEAGIGVGDVISIGAIVKGTTPGQGIKFAYRFFSGSPTNFITPQAAFPAITVDGTEQAIKAENITIPSGATGVAIYTYGSGTLAEYHTIDIWAVRGAKAGDIAPDRLSNYLLDKLVAAGSTVSAIKARTDWAFLSITTVSYSALAIAAAASVTGSTPRDLTFFGHGQAWAKPASISFNAIRLKSVVRASTATAKWSYIKVRVSTHASNAALGAATLLAVGEVRVNPDTAPLSELIIVLKDPSTGAVKTITEADLLNDFFVGWYAKTESGSDAAAGETTGTVAGLTRRQSYYITNANPLTSDWSANTGNPSLAIELLSLTSPVEATTPTASSAMRADMGTGAASASLTNPAPHEVIMPPRLFGVVGREMNVYLTELHSAVDRYAYNVDSSPAAFGKLLSDCWRNVPAGTASNVQVTFQTLQRDHINLLSSKTVRADVVAASAPSGAARRILAIGDSTTNAGVWTQRLLDVDAGNASSVQVTLMGTRGSGLNKHEGRGGWSFGRYFQPTGSDVAENPFVQTDGGKFDCAYYLSSTSQAAPDIVIWHLGINDVFGATSDATVNGIMDTAIDQLNRMIGITVDGAVGSIKESNANAVNIIAVPIPPAGSADAFGDDYDVGQTLERYKRNIKVVSHRLIEAYRTREADKIFLVPWHVAIDPVHGWTRTAQPANQSVAVTTVATYAGQLADLSPADGVLFYCTDAAAYIVKVGATGKGGYREATEADGIVFRQDNGVHPGTRGYNQMGDTMSDAINALVALGLA